MKIEILNLGQVFLDGKAHGSFAAACAARPDLLGELQSALVAWFGAATADLQASLDTANATIARLQAELNPPPLPDYYQVHPLPEQQPPRADGATHAGLRRPPEIGGFWLADFLKETSANQFRLVQAGIEIPADKKLTSYSELNAESFQADLAAYLMPSPAEASASALSAAEEVARPSP